MPAPSNLITFLTDYGHESPYTGIIKGVVYSINPKANIVDITHNINPQNIEEAAFILKQSYKYFPPGTIHVVIVDPGVGTKRKILLVKTQNYYFIAPDNGVLSYIYKEGKVQKIYEVDNDEFFLKKLSSTFHGRDIFSPVAAHLSNGVDVKKFGKQVNDFIFFALETPNVMGKEISAKIIYIDHFGNLVTNLSKKLFDVYNKGEYSIKFKGYHFDKVSESYAEVPVNEPLVIFSSIDRLEIAVNSNNARKYFDAKVGDEITIRLK